MVSPRTKRGKRARYLIEEHQILLEIILELGKGLLAHLEQTRGQGVGHGQRVRTRGERDVLQDALRGVAALHAIVDALRKFDPWNKHC